MLCRSFELLSTNVGSFKPIRIAFLCGCTGQFGTPFYFSVVMLRKPNNEFQLSSIQRISEKLEKRIFGNIYLHKEGPNVRLVLDVLKCSKMFFTCYGINETGFLNKSQKKKNK